MGLVEGLAMGLAMGTLPVRGKDHVFLWAATYGTANLTSEIILSLSPSAFLSPAVGYWT